MRLSSYCLALLATAALLGGCAATGPQSQATVGAYQDTVTRAGRLSVNYDKDGKLETLSGKFSWVQKAGVIDVGLMSPLGQTIATIRVTPQSATLTQSDGKARTAADIDTLTAQTLGWSLPVNGLRDWMQGHALQAGGARFAASPANNSVTTDDGWQLTFVTWQDAAAAQPVPKRIDARRAATAISGELALRIVIDEQG